MELLLKMGSFPTKGSKSLFFCNFLLWIKLFKADCPLSVISFIDWLGSI